MPNPDPRTDLEVVNDLARHVRRASISRRQAEQDAWDRDRHLFDALQRLATILRRVTNDEQRYCDGCGRVLEHHEPDGAQSCCTGTEETA